MLYMCSKCGNTCMLFDEPAVHKDFIMFRLCMYAWSNHIKAKQVKYRLIWKGFKSDIPQI